MPDACLPPAPRTERHPACPLCGAIGKTRYPAITDRAYGVPGEWSVLECSACHIAWADPQPIDEDIAGCYPGVYHTHEPTERARPSAFGTPGLGGLARDAILAGYFGYDVGRIGSTGRAVGWLLGSIPELRGRVSYSQDDSLPTWREGGRLLDIGCGAGAYLDFARSLGWTTYGIEPDPAAAEITRRSGAVVYPGVLGHVDLPDAPFDAVSSNHSIEHYGNPRVFLQRMYSLLRPGGFFYLKTPNYGSLMRRRFGADWYALELPRHLTFLTPRAMRELLTETGAWNSISVKTCARRAKREQEQTIAMRREGSFEATTSFSRADRMSINVWASLEKLGNTPMEWGEEIEVIGIKA